MFTRRSGVFVSAFFNFTLSLYAERNPPRECLVVMPDIFNDCDGRLVYTKYYHKTHNNSGIMCPNKIICKRHFNVSFFKAQLYGPMVSKLFFEMMHGCCGKCFSYSVVNNFTQMSQLNRTSMGISDFIFPILGSLSTEKKYGFYYIPVVEVSSAYYLTLSETRRSKMLKMVNGCISMWPVLCICVMMCLISGFIIWLTERRQNWKEFPVAFRTGFFEGFWWSFVSMTTVGYGDKIPKSYPGRLYACLWILTGISLFSLFTATLTSLMADIYSLDEPKMLGKRVGGLRNRLHDATMIAQHGGFFQDIAYNQTIHGIAELILRLDRKEIDGILLSRSTYYYFARNIHLKKYSEYAEKVKHVSIVKSEKHFHGEKFAQGMLVKDHIHYIYFRKYFKDNWLQVQDCQAFSLNDRGAKYSFHEVSEANLGLYIDCFYGLSIILGVVALFGLIQEVHSYCKPNLTKHDKEEDKMLTEIHMT